MSQTFFQLRERLAWLSQHLLPESPAEGLIESLQAGIAATDEMQSDLWRYRDSVEEREESLKKDRKSFEKKESKLRSWEDRLTRQEVVLENREQKLQGERSDVLRQQRDANWMKKVYEDKMEKGLSSLATSDQVVSLAQDVKSLLESPERLAGSGGSTEAGIVELLKHEIEGALTTQRTEYHERQQQQDRPTRELLEGVQSRLASLELASSGQQRRLAEEPAVNWKAEAEKLQNELEAARENATALQERVDKLSTLAEATEKSHGEEVERLKRKAADAEAEVQRKKPHVGEGPLPWMTDSPWRRFVADMAKAMSWINVKVVDGSGVLSDEECSQIMAKLSRLLSTERGRRNLNYLVDFAAQGYWYCAQEVAEGDPADSYVLPDGVPCPTHQGCTCLYLRRLPGGLRSVEYRIE